MKHYFLAQLLIIFTLLINQATSIVKYNLYNYRINPAFNLISLGKFSPGDYITFQYLTTQRLGFIIYYYGIDPQTGAYVTLNDGDGWYVQGVLGKRQNYTIQRFDQELFLAMKLNRILKFTVKVTNSDGVEYIPKGSQNFGNQFRPYTIAKQFVIRGEGNSCWMALDRRNMTGINDKHTVIFNSVSLTPSAPAYDKLIPSTGFFKLSIDLAGSKVNVTDFFLSIPIYLDVNCYLMETYSCNYTYYEYYCRIFDGFKCLGSNRTYCQFSCGDGVTDIEAGQQCDGGSGCDRCQLLCGNGKIDPGQQCEGGDLCGPDCRFYCGNKKVEIERGQQCDGTVGCGVDCKIRCGNAKMDPGQQCEGGDLCGPDCKFLCGNGKVDAGQQCDGGTLCGANCKLLCGNKKIDLLEQCDGGILCGPDCKFLCGNGKVDSGEVCDGQTGCDANCQALCGNGILESPEVCDNGNQKGCALCKIVSGYKCFQADRKSFCSLICQTNNILEDGEGCDNGGNDGCKNCKIISPYKCINTIGKPSFCYICGNSIQQGDEQCDNGNKKGCTNCTLDRGYICQAKLMRISNCSTTCGDGLWVQQSEACDNGNQTGCINCIITPKFTCKNTETDPSICTQCGNFLLQYPEECDNNNTKGCINCLIQPGWNCRANPKYCYRTAAICGNGERQIKELCDDGNIIDGDGCNRSCKIQIGYTCTRRLGEKSICN